MVRATLICLALLAGHVVAADHKVGDTVFYKGDKVAKDGDDVLDDNKLIGWPATVEKVEGDYIWVVSSRVNKNEVMSLDEAFELSDLGIKKNPKSAEAWRCRAVCWSEKGNLHKALDDFQEALHLDPDDLVSYMGRGRARIMLEDFEGAISDCDQAIRLAPERGHLYINRGTAKDRAGQFEGAIHDFNEGIRLGAESWLARFGRAHAKMELNDLTGALEDFDRAIRIDPRISNAYQGRASVKRKLGDFEGAIEDYAAIIRFEPTSVGGYLNRGWAFHCHGDYANAIKDYMRAEQLDSSCGPLKCNVAFLYATCPDEKMRDGERALQWSEEALKIAPESSYAFNAKACALALLGQFDDAIKLEERALKDRAYVSDSGIDGGVAAKERIVAWKEKKLWFTKPEK